MSSSLRYTATDDRFERDGGQGDWKGENSMVFKVIMNEVVIYREYTRISMYFLPVF